MIEPRPNGRHELADEQQTGAHAFLAALEARRIEFLFNLPGTQTLALLALIADRAADQGGVRPIFVRHEQAAAFGAVGYAKLTGRPAVCLVVPGPGATNLLTGVTSALADGIPLVAATPQVPAELIGRGVVHDSDLDGLFRAAVKAQVRVDRAEDLGAGMIEAIDRSLASRSGPVQLLFPASLFSAPLPVGAASERSERPPAGLPKPNLAEVVERIRAARRPILYVGDRVRLGGASTALVALAEQLGAPVVTDEGARGVIPEDHPLSLGTASFRFVDEALAQGDLCLAVGTTFPEWSTGSWRLPLPRPLLHLNDDPAAFDRNYPADLAIAGDLPALLASLLDALPAQAAGEEGWGAAAVLPVRRRGMEAMLSERAAYTAENGAGLHPVDVARTLREELPRNAVVCVDGSATAAWMNEQSFPVLADGGFIQPEIFKELGSALLMGIGCRLGAPDREVVVVQGDGGLLFQIGELSTLIHNEIKVVIVVFEDGYYNGDRIFQEHMFGGRESDCLLFNPDFVQLTTAFGLPAYRARTLAELRSSLVAALADERSSLVTVAIDAMPVPSRLKSRIEEWKRRTALLKGEPQPS